MANRTREMDSREIGTVLAALRHWQKTNKRADRWSKLISTDDSSFAPLTSIEIDLLCEQINYSGKDRVVIPCASNLPKRDKGED